MRDKVPPARIAPRKGDTSYVNIISNFQYTDEDFQVSTELILFQLEFFHLKANKSFPHQSFSELSVFFSFFIFVTEFLYFAVPYSSNISVMLHGRHHGLEK